LKRSISETFSQGLRNDTMELNRQENRRQFVMIVRDGHKLKEKQSGDQLPF